MWTSSSRDRHWRVMRARPSSARLSPAGEGSSLDQEGIPHPDERPWVIVEKLQDIPAADAEYAAIRLSDQPGA